MNSLNKNESLINITKVKSTQTDSLREAIKKYYDINKTKMNSSSTSRKIVIKLNESQSLTNRVDRFREFLEKHAKNK